MSIDSLTDDDIKVARISLMISRETFEAALWGDLDARALVVVALRGRTHRRWVEDVT